jgi:sugar phosphate isomerase/epimerase
MNSISRRHFLKSSALAAGSLSLGSQAALALEPLKRKGGPRMLLSLAAYSFRNYFKSASHPPDATTESPKRIDLFDFIDYCAENGCDGAELTSYYFPKDVTDDYLLQIRRHAFLRGVEVSGTAVGNNFALPKGDKLNEQIASVKKWIDRAAIFGAPHIRVFAGAAAKGLTDAEARKMCIGALEECCDYAGKKGVFLGLENHGGIVAESDGLLEIVKAVNSPWFGVNLDTGNFHTDDPYADLAKCAPYAINVQVKTNIHLRDKKEVIAADLPKLFKIFRDANYQGYVALEYETKEDPWQAVPPILKQMRRLISD